MDALSALGDPAGIEVAMLTADSGPTLILAIRVPGVDASEAGDALIAARLASIGADAEGDGRPLAVPSAAADVEGQTVSVLDGAEDDLGRRAYTFGVGEVTFLVIAPGDAGDPESPAAAALAALRQSLSTSIHGPAPEPQRIEFVDHGLALTVPAAWRPQPGTIDDDEARIERFESPRGSMEWCDVSREEFDGRVTPQLIERIQWDEGAQTVERVQTGAGEAVRVGWTAPWESDTFDSDRMAGTFTRHLLPWGNAVYGASCFVGHAEGATPSDPGLEIAGTFEFLEPPAPGAANEIVESARELLCSVVVPLPDTREAAMGANRAMPRVRLADLRREIRRFFRRHGDATADLRSPQTAVAPFYYNEDGEDGPNGWFKGRLRQSRALAEVDEAVDDRLLREFHLSDVASMFALAPALLDDPEMRPDAIRAIEAVYHHAAKSHKNPLKGWAYMNNVIDAELRHHDLEPCTEGANEVPS